jgi:hypothetical protein
MSRQIDYSQPVTGEDRAFAAQFPGLHGQMLEVNAQQFPEVVEEEETLEGADSGETDDNYDELTVKDLQAEVDRRNAEEGTSLSREGRKSELVARLREDDVARA